MVVLPAPLGPVTTSSSPGRAVNDTVAPAIKGGERVLIRRARPEDVALYRDFLADVSAEDLLTVKNAGYTDAQIEDIARASKAVREHGTPPVPVELTNRKGHGH